MKLRITVTVLVTALLLAVGLGVQAQGAKKHKHKVFVFYNSAEKPIGPNAVEFVTAFCPGGTALAGGGSSTDGIATVNEQRLEPDTNSVTVFYINDFFEGATIGAQAACVGGTSKKKARQASVASDERAAVLAEAREKERQLEAMLARDK